MTQKTYEMDSAMDETAGRTVDELERRLMRIKYVLAGFSDTTDEELHKIQSAGREQTVAARLTALEHALARLSKRSPMVQDAMKLCKKSTYVSLIRSGPAPLTVF